MNRLLRMFPDEFALDGWSAPQVRGGKDRWTDRAIVRAALLLDEVPSAPAAEIRYRLDVAALPVAFFRAASGESDSARGFFCSGNGGG